MERYEIENSKEYKLAKHIEDVINTFSFNEQVFAESVRYFHPTLQQSFVRIMKTTLLAMAQKNWYADGRNKASKELALQLQPALENACLPFV